ncbi:MAG TPA: hydantoinase B/oxoprolinase family protein [Solirubrobacterales bacterium]|nr:hydantoinase B/oxoprolinase family protein [Solirubrobacterales bacterium]
MLLGVDVGGTFTDAVLFDGATLHTAKTPTTPGEESVGTMAAIEQVLRRAGARAADVESFSHGMTVGTNALLEERGARTALIATRGFADQLEIGRQNRPDLYRLCAPKPAPLVEPQMRFEAAERMGPEGAIQLLADGEPERLAQALRESGAESVAVCLLFSYVDPAHERRIAEHLRRELPGVHVSASHEVLPRFREYERCSTTAIDAYLSPLLGDYLSRLKDVAADAGLPQPLVMRSSGGVTGAEEAARAGAWSVLSGPAGGAVGASLLAGISGDGNALGFDMGGTSCDVCVVEDGKVRRTDSRTIGGRVIQLPMVDVHTVGAGGGSVGWRDPGGALRVGPRSAGADPGPACYGGGGAEPTVTDANLLLGYLAADSKLAGGVALDVGAARGAVTRLADSLGLDELEAAEGIVRVANQEMVRALRVVTVERGVDPRRFALLPFGGAGPMHAAAIAAELGVERILCPRAGGVLSALGLCASDRRRDTARTVMLSGRALTAARIAREVEDLIATEDHDLQGAEPEVAFGMRYRGQAFELTIAGPVDPDPADLAERFAAAHEERYGYRDPAGEIELVDIRLAMVVTGPQPQPAASVAGRLVESARRARFGGEWIEARVLRGEPPAGARAEGPAIFELPEATFVLPPGWSAEVDDTGTIRAQTRKRASAATYPRISGISRSGTAQLGPIELQVMSGGLRAACEEMGAVLIRASHSANIKERRDCSTALFDARGELVMQAEHIPVHLGSMPDAVAAILDREQRPGEAWILNDPYRGGTHLPDITLIDPVFVEGSLLGFVASRAHHADVGGPTPGGMPAGSTRLEDEGVVIPPTRADDETLRELAERMRSPRQRLADLRAQRAANRVGAQRLIELAERHGLDELRAGMAETLAYAERRTRAALANLPDGTYTAEDVLEDDFHSAATYPGHAGISRSGASRDVTLRVAATIEGDRLTLDFTGTDAQVEGNLNCPLSVTKSAAFFAVRALTDPDAPPSAGAHRPIEAIAPEGCLLNAHPGAAVAAGNVETSSRVADLVISALGCALPAPAQGQGTMNNLTLAGEGFTYYETLGGGQGACPDADGPSAIHVAMSNTLNTPIEALETEFPLRVRELSVRRGSGGDGRQNGGDGIVRDIEALAPMRFTLITERRRHPPRGRDGGADGAPGRNLVNDEPLPSKAEGSLRPGDRLRIETPGGGGAGSKDH